MKVAGTYHFDVFKIFDVIHLSLDQLKQDTACHVRNRKSQMFRKRNLLLTFRFLLGETLSVLFRDKIVPLQLPAGSLTHSSLEGPKLGDSLQLLDGLNRFLQEIRVGIAFGRFVHDGFECDRVFLKVLSRATEEVFEIEAMGIRVSGTLLL